MSIKVETIPVVGSQVFHQLSQRNFLMDKKTLFFVGIVVGARRKEFLRSMKEIVFLYK